MNATHNAIWILAFLFVYLATPATLVWGWARWVGRPKCWKFTETMSLIGLGVATASALLAIGTAAYARVHHFPFFDPLLLRIIFSGMFTSLGALIAGIAGVWRPSSIRWHAMAGAAGTLAFWVLATAFE